MNSYKKFPKIIYNTLNQETNYDCQGDCTCKYIKNRTEFDINQSHYTEDKDKYKNNVHVLKNNSKSTNETRGWLM